MVIRVKEGICRGAGAQGRELFCIILALVVSGCSRCDVSNSDIKTDAVATVGSNVITSGDFLFESGRRRQADQDKVIDGMVRRELLFAEAQRTGFDKSPEMVEAWRTLVINRFAGRQQGYSEALPPPTADELKAYYEAHLDRFNVPDRVHVALIYLRQDPLAQADRKRALLARAETLRQTALAGAEDIKDFGVLARDNSDHRSSRNKGGDVGWIDKSAVHTGWPTEVTAAIFALRQPGEIRPAIEAPEGIYLVKLIERQASHPSPFEQVRARVEHQFVRERAEKAEAEFYARLRATFPVVINTQRLNEIARTAAVAKATPPPMPAR